MSINPILLNATIQRVQDFSTMKQNVDQKGMVEQNIIQHSLEKHDVQKATQVVHQDNTEMMNKKFDAREKGSNQYQGDGGKRRKQQKENQNGRVVKKGEDHRFDMKI